MPRFKPRTIHRSCTEGNYWNTPYWKLVGLGILERSHIDGEAAGETHADTQCQDCCVDCPEDGASCSHEGITLETIPLEENWWRATDVSTVLYSCSLSEACRGVSTTDYKLGNVSLCRSGHKGAAQPESQNVASREGALVACHSWERAPRLSWETAAGALCGVCARNFHFDSVENTCLECADQPLDVRGSRPSVVSDSFAQGLVLSLGRTPSKDKELHLTDSQF